MIMVLGINVIAIIIIIMRFLLLLLVVVRVVPVLLFVSPCNLIGALLCSSSTRLYVLPLFYTRLIKCDELHRLTSFHFLHGSSLTMYKGRGLLELMGKRVFFRALYSITTE